MSDCKPIVECIACGSKNLVPVLDLGFQPLANDYVRDSSKYHQSFPLAINRCNHCYHVQLTHQVNPELMFKDYAYVSGVSRTTLEWFKWVVEFAKKQYNDTVTNVLDIGCNDGTMLDAWGNMETYGVDPAENLHSVSTGKGHNVHCGFFTGKEFGDKKFDVITCLNAFAHNADQLSLLRNVKEIMHDNSVLICSTSQADMILNGEFDTIYHEHVSFYNIMSANALCKRAGLNLIDVVKHPIHGNSYMFVISKSKQNTVHVNKLIYDESLTGLYEPEIYEEFMEKANLLAEKFASIIRAYRRSDVPVIGYSAPAKGSTLMNFAQEGPDLIFEDTPQKQGTYSPGLQIPIVAPDYKLVQHRETVVWIPLAWNFFNEITNKIKAARPDAKDIFLRTMPNMWLENDEGGSKVR